MAIFVISYFTIGFLTSLIQFGRCLEAYYNDPTQETQNWHLVSPARQSIYLAPQFNILNSLMNKIHGNIFKGKWDGMAQGCNLYNVMGGGIAKEVKRLFPAAYEADQKALLAGGVKLGFFSHCRTTAEGEETLVDIFNLYSQEGIGNNGEVLGRNARYDAINDGLFRVCEYIMQTKDSELYVLALPEIGCGLAGGEDRIVHAIMESVEQFFPAITFDLYIFKKAP